MSFTKNESENRIRFLGEIIFCQTIFNSQRNSELSEPTSHENRRVNAKKNREFYL